MEFSEYNSSSNPLVTGLWQGAAEIASHQKSKLFDVHDDMSWADLYSESKQVMVIQTLRCGLVLVSSANMDHDGYLHLTNEKGSLVPIAETQDSLRPLALDQVFVGQRVCIPNERGVLACEMLELLRSESGGKRNHFRLVSLCRLSSGQVIAGGAIIETLRVYEFPQLIRVLPVNPMQSIPPAGEMALFVQTEHPIGAGHERQLTEKSNSDESDIQLKQLAFSEFLLKVMPHSAIPAHLYLPPFEVLSKRGYLLLTTPTDLDVKMKQC